MLGYLHTSSKTGRQYQLRGSKTSSGMATNFFTVVENGEPRSVKGEPIDLPADKTVVETKNGFPILKRVVQPE